MLPSAVLIIRLMPQPVSGITCHRNAGQPNLPVMMLCICPIAYNQMGFVCLQYVPRSATLAHYALLHCCSCVLTSMYYHCSELCRPISSCGRFPPRQACCTRTSSISMVSRHQGSCVACFCCANASTSLPPCRSALPECGIVSVTVPRACIYAVLCLYNQ